MKFLVMLIVVGSSLAVAQTPDTSEVPLDRVGPHPIEQGSTPNHWTLAPAGLQVEVGDRPMGVAKTPDGQYLIISNNGQGVQSLVLFDMYTDEIAQVIFYPSPEALFLGVAVSVDGERVYARRAATTRFACTT